MKSLGSGEELPEVSSEFLDSQPLIAQSDPFKTIIEKIQSDGEVIEKKYIKGKFLGKGGFAKCYELTDCETREKFAVKVVVKASLTKSRAK